MAEQVGKVDGVKKVLLAENDVFKGLLPGKCQLCLNILDSVHYHFVTVPCEFLDNT